MSRKSLDELKREIPCDYPACKKEFDDLENCGAL